MKRIIYILIICFQVNIYGQNLIELPSEYYFDTKEALSDRILIRKLLNPSKHLQEQIDSIQSLNDTAQDNFFKDFGDNEVVNLLPGNYHCLSIKEKEITFTINNNGFLDGQATYQNLRKKDYKTTITFDNGFWINSKTKNILTDVTYSEIEVKDFIQTVTKFYPSGKLESKEIEDFRIKGGREENTIRILFYENGNVRSEDNNINKTFKSFFDNKKLETISDEKNGFEKRFNQNGVMESQFYKKGKNTCKEYYNRGKLTSKLCDNEIENKEFFYENGVLTQYEVHNKLLNTNAVYNSKNKLLKGVKIPRIKIVDPE